MKKGTKVAVGVGAGLAAAGLAAYLFTGKRGKQNRQTLKAWASKVEKEATAQMKKLKNIRKEDYLRMVAQAADTYEKFAAEPARKKKPKAQGKKK